MKRLTLTVATLLGGFHAIAQNNNSTVIQTGDFNRALVTETGTHTSSVLQKSNAGSAMDENLATVTQSNITATGVKNSVSKVEQHGNSHISTVTQVGQNSLEAYIGSNGSVVAQNVNNETFANQYGQGNNGKQFIQGSSAEGSFFSLRQNGSDNTSEQTANDAQDSKGYVTQSGHRNDAWQFLEGSGNEAHIEQSQDDNVAFQEIVGSGSQDNYSKILQTGDENIVRVVTEGDNNDFNATQLGDRNRVLGLTGTLTSFAGQTGSGNNALLTQSGNDNEFLILQNGDGNIITGATSLGALQLGNGNSAIYSQDGADNKIISDQYGDNNKETITQVGNGHISTVYQSGASNRATVRQTDN
ncbi:hypothetical protein [Dyadobacter sp. CY312]|uniref:hypothetical protein n=1 Tax=Dyadobacter sp. CY312 TaxID=2907303 RepID=UPI001F1CBE1D|nr:hypothetical protein [Dyadobacter sp. CY312]MCE7042643.1 hypothetical protein [Dyadobacter sp. CY312]